MATKYNELIDFMKKEFDIELEKGIEWPVETRDEYDVKYSPKKKRTSSKGFGPMASSHKETGLPWSDPSTGKIHKAEFPKIPPLPKPKPKVVARKKAAIAGYNKILRRWPSPSVNKG